MSNKQSLILYHFKKHTLTKEQNKRLKIPISAQLRLSYLEASHETNKAFSNNGM